MAAAVNGQAAAARLLINKGCDVNIEVDGKTALSFACLHRHEEVVKVIIENSNANIEQRLQVHYLYILCAE